MAHKQIYYSDKYFDEHYEYRWAAFSDPESALLAGAPAGGATKA